MALVEKVGLQAWRPCQADPLLSWGSCPAGPSSEFPPHGEGQLDEYAPGDPALATRHQPEALGSPGF